MNLDKLISIAVAVVIGAAAVGKFDVLQNWIWRAQAKLVYESRASAWGSPRFFVPNAEKTQIYRANH